MENKKTNKKGEIGPKPGLVMILHREQSKWSLRMERFKPSVINQE